ncbi:MAG: hypothetical protein HY756_06100 [Nitrospirae bacterium]|nr:hypothetical protein [Nitrospirota bacterium]
MFRKLDWLLMPTILICILSFTFTTASSAVNGKQITTWGNIKAGGKSDLPLMAAPQFRGSSEIGKMTTPNGEHYYIVAEEYDSKKKSERMVEVWARKRLNACSVGDYHLYTLKSTSNASSAKRTLCKLKEYYDNGKIFLGCSATVAAFLCPAECGSLVACGVCIAAIGYVTEGGVEDCITGIIKKVAGVPIIIQPGWADLGELIIDELCQ